MKKQLIWDIPTRLFHWLLVACITAQYITAEILENAIQWHFYIGYFTLGLILFRIIWGVIGTHYAKFSEFLAGPTRIMSYIKTLPKKDSHAHAGHNPVGGWMVMVLLALVAIQGISGLFITDDIYSNGPYYDAVSESTRDIMNTIHHTAFNVLLGAIALHIIAIIFYALFKKQRLVGAMVHGKKSTAQKGITSSKLLLAVVIATLCAAVMYYIIVIAPPAPVEEFFY